MAVNTKAIKRRIQSVGNTKKITKAMEMVAAAKMRRAVEAAINTRTYAKMAWDLLTHLSRIEKTGVPLLAVRPVKRLLVVLITSNRGLCGSFNSNIIRKTGVQMRNPSNIGRQRIGEKELPAVDNIVVEVASIGKKGAEFAKKMGYHLTASYTDLPDTPSLNDILPLAKSITQDYEAGNYDKVVVAYTDYKSTINLVAKLRQVLPISETDLEKMLVDLQTDATPQSETASMELDDYLFEPGKKEVLNTILPRLVETQIYQALLESTASEHSARMMAMRNASDAATDMIRELNLNFNKARQAAITQEIAEIAGGAAALE